jgi:hypothetical protein
MEDDAQPSSTNQLLEEKRLWRVRYVEKHQLGQERFLHVIPVKNAFFFAAGEAESQQHIKGWLHYIKHDEAQVLSVEPTPAGFAAQWQLYLQQRHMRRRGSQAEKHYSVAIQTIAEMEQSQGTRSAPCVA